MSGGGNEEKRKSNFEKVYKIRDPNSILEGHSKN
jgi:hypothetical protein